MTTEEPHDATQDGQDNRTTGGIALPLPGTELAEIAWIAMEKILMAPLTDAWPKIRSHEGKQPVSRDEPLQTALSARWFALGDQLRFCVKPNHWAPAVQGSPLQSILTEITAASATELLQSAADQILPRDGERTKSPSTLGTQIMDAVAKVRPEVEDAILQAATTPEACTIDFEPSGDSFTVNLAPFHWLIVRSSDNADTGRTVDQISAALHLTPQATRRYLRALTNAGRLARVPTYLVTDV